MSGYLIMCVPPALRAKMRADAGYAPGNVDDLAEVRRVQAEMNEISAW
jgi:hypothetical protein